MPILVIVRHAKAVSTAACSDYDRQLDERGAAQAEELGSYLAGRLKETGATRSGSVPAGACSIVASSARRTKLTARAIQQAQPGSTLTTEGGLYQADPDDWLEAIRAATPEASALVLVGHQPIMSQTAAWLAADDADTAELAHFPPATAALLEIEGAWAEAAPGTASLLEVRRSPV